MPPIRLLAAPLLFIAQPAVADVPQWVSANCREILAEYVELLAIPNVAGNVADIRRNADHLVAMMERRGLAPRILEGERPEVPPAVYGEWTVPGAARTFMVYAHYDGQPVTPEDWRSTAPFEPQLRSGRLDHGGEPIPLPDGCGDPDWRIYGRSASDDKLGVMAIFAAVDALRASGQAPAFNLKIFLEGEEEAGSPNLASILDRHRDLLRSDGWIIIDGPAHATGAPQVVLGVRGDVNVDVTVHGPVRPLHSGHYGNWAPNPAMMMARLLASMKDESGRVTIDGFYDDVTPLTAAERETIAAVPSADAQLRAELGLARTEGGGRPLLELVHEPSLNVNGMRSADAGRLARNVIPATATATLDLRLVQGNDHRRQAEKVIRHIERQGYLVLDREPTIEERRRHPMIATVVPRRGYNSERTPLDHPLARSVAAAMRGRGEAVMVPTLGGSLPLYLFRETLGVPTVTVSLANHDNNQHAEDENVRLGNVWMAIEAAAAIMRME